MGICRDGDGRQHHSPSRLLMNVLTKLTPQLPCLALTSEMTFPFTQLERRPCWQTALDRRFTDRVLFKWRCKYTQSRFPPDNLFQSQQRKMVSDLSQFPEAARASSSSSTANANRDTTTVRIPSHRIGGHTYGSITVSGDAFVTQGSGFMHVASSRPRGQSHDSDWTALQTEGGAPRGFDEDMPAIHIVDGNVNGIHSRAPSADPAPSVVVPWCV